MKLSHILSQPKPRACCRLTLSWTVVTSMIESIPCSEMCVCVCACACVSIDCCSNKTLSFVFEQQERFRTYCTLLHMRLCLPPSSTLGISTVTRSASAVGTAEEHTQDSEPRTSPLRSSSSAADSRRSASDRYSYHAAISQQSDDWPACLASPAADLLTAFDSVTFLKLVCCIGSGLKLSMVSGLAW